MKRIELTPRLRMMADFIPQGVRLADIGTDHAYLPAALMLEGKISEAIASDLRQGPLNRAKSTVNACGLQGRIGFRLCDGLQGIRPDEADVISIAGMGGETIAMILDAAPWVKCPSITLVLQPMSTIQELRVWLMEHGFCIVEERLAQEGTTLYTAMLVREGTMTLTETECWVGKNTHDPLRRAWLEQWERRLTRAKTGMEQAKKENVQTQIEALERILCGIRMMKEEWDTWQS